MITEGTSFLQVDCRSASKGLFLGLLCLVGGIVILIIFFVMKDQEEFKTRMFWISNSTQLIILGLSVVSTIIGFLQIPKLSVSTSKPLDLDRLLLSSTIIGVYVFAVFGMIVGGINYTDSEYLATFCVHALLLLQVRLLDYTYNHIFTEPIIVCSTKDRTAYNLECKGSCQQNTV